MRWSPPLQKDLQAILRFGAEELFKEEEERQAGEQRLQNIDIDEVLARAERMDTTAAAAQGNELLSAFTVTGLQPFSYIYIHLYMY